MRYIVLFLLMTVVTVFAEEVVNDRNSNTVYFVFRNTTTGLVDNDISEADIDLYYVEEPGGTGTGGLISAGNTSTIVATDAYTSLGAIELGQGGLCRIDFPDAAFDGGIGRKVQLIAVPDSGDNVFEETLVIDLIAEYSTAAEMAKVPKSDGAVSWNATALAAIELQANDALVDERLDHLVAVADDDDPVENSIIAKLAAADGDWTKFDEALHSLRALRVRGDAAWDTATGFSTHDAAAVKTAIEAGGSHLALILADTGAYDTDAEYAAAIWGATTTDYDDGGTFGLAVGDINTDTAAYDTDAEHAAAIWGAVMENSVTYAEVMRVFAAVLSGKSSIAGADMTFVGIDGSTNRLVVTVSSGARTSVGTWDGSP